MNIYVGNLAYGIREDELRSVFENHSAVDSVKIVMDRDASRSKGFGFVEMPNDSGSPHCHPQLRCRAAGTASPSTKRVPASPVRTTAAATAAIAGNRLTSVIHEKGAHCDGRLSPPPRPARQDGRHNVRGAPSEDAMSPTVTGCALRSPRRERFDEIHAEGERSLGLFHPRLDDHDAVGADRQVRDLEGNVMESSRRPPPAAARAR